jgi:hypothetical protein
MVASMGARPRQHRGFGVAAAVALAIWSVRHFIKAGEVAPAPLVAAVVLALIEIMRPGLLALPSRIWSKLLFVINFVFEPILLALIFYIVLTPIALLSRLMGKTRMHLQFDRKIDSYWEQRSPQGSIPGSMRNQF